MRIAAIVILVIFAFTVKGQSPCTHVKLYDEMIVTGDKPMFHKLKKFDVKLIPDSTLQGIKSEMIRHTSPQFYRQLKIKSVKLFDSAVARAWSWTQPPITDKNSNPVFHFYAVVFETTFNNTPFAFRVDFLENGELLNEDQLDFFAKGQFNIMNCEEITSLLSKNTTEPINLIEEMYFAYSLKEHAIVWSIASVVDPKTGNKYFKEINAVTGEIIHQSSANMNTPPPLEKLNFKNE